MQWKEGRKECGTEEKNTIERPCATTSRKRPPPISDCLSKTPKLSQPKPYSWTFRKRPPSVSDRDHFWGWKVHDFLWFLTSYKRQLDAFSDVYVRCAHCATLSIRRILETKWNYTWRNLQITCNKLSSIKLMYPDLFSEETPRGSILVSDHLP